MSRWSPSVHPVPGRNEMSEALSTALETYIRSKEQADAKRERTAERAQQQANVDRTFQLQQSDRTADNQRADDALGLQRAEAASQGMLYRPGGDRVYERTGSQVAIPEVMPGMGGSTMEGVRPKPGVTVLGGGYYRDQALTPQGRAAAQAQVERERQRQALIARGYKPEDADLIVNGTVRAEDVGPIAEERTGRDIRKYRAEATARELASRADGHTSPADAARMVQEYDEGTNQQLKLADMLVPNDPLWRPRTGADSANVATADSLRTEAKGRMAHRPTIQSFLGMSSTPKPVTKTPAQWVGEVKADQSWMQAHPDATAQEIAAEARRRAGQ